MSHRCVWVPVMLEIETDMAWRVDFGADTSIWLPKSQIEDYSEEEFASGDNIEIEIPEWLAMKNGMI